MRNSLIGVFFLATAISGYCQFPECISSPDYQGYSVSNVLVNSSGEMLLHPGNVPTGLVMRMDKSGNVRWWKDLGNNAPIRKAWLDDSGNAYFLKFDYSQQDEFYSFSKYNSNGQLAWAEKVFLETEKILYSFTVDQLGNIFLVGDNISQDIDQDTSLYVVKFNANGVQQWESILDEGLSDNWGLNVRHDIVSNDAGEMFVLASLGMKLTNTHEFLKLSSTGNVVWRKKVNFPDDGTFYDLSVTTDLDISGNITGVIKRDYADVPRTDLYKVNGVTGNISASKSLLLRNPKVDFGDTETYVFGYNNADTTVLVLSSMLTTVLEFKPKLPSHSPAAIRSDGKGSIYIAHSRGGSFGKGPTIFADKYTNGNLDWRVLKSGYVETMAFDYEGNLLFTSFDCLVRVIPCDRFKVEITTQPKPVEVCSGMDANFTSSATGTGLKYFWIKGTTVLTNSTKYSGVNSQSFTIHQVTPSDTGAYHCEVRDTCLNVVKTQTANLSITTPPLITAQPEDASQCTGSDAFFQVAVSGGKNVKFQWKKGASALMESAKFTGTKTNKLIIKTLTTGDIGEYYCEITADCNSQAIVTQRAVLGVSATTSIMANPSSISLCTGGVATFSVAANGTGITYQWKKAGTNLVNNARTTGATASTLTITAINSQDSGEYTCVVTGTCGGGLTSTKAVLAVGEQQQITSHPVGQSICDGSNASFVVKTTGSGVTFQWMKGNTSLVNNAKYSGVTTSTLNVIKASSVEAGAYVCQITTSCGDKIFSNAAQLNVGTTTAITSKSPDLTLCSGETAKFSIASTGEVNTYQWKKNNVALTDGNDIAGSKTAELYVNDVTTDAAGTYTCEIKPVCGATQTSGGIKLAIQTEVAISQQPLPKDLCDDEDLILEVVALGLSPTFQWKKNGVNVLDGSHVTGSKTARLIIRDQSTAAEGYYTCEVKGCNGTVSSDGVMVSVFPKPDLVLVDPVNCIEFTPSWSSIVLDNQNTVGDYFLYKDGTDEPLADINSIIQTGYYSIIKRTQTCADTLVWNNECVITDFSESSSPEFTISPNPTNRWIKLTYGVATGRQFAIYDTRGNRIREGDLDSKGEILLDGNEWSDGVYMVMLRHGGDEVSFRRFILQR